MPSGRILCDESRTDRVSVANLDFENDDDLIGWTGTWEDDSGIYSLEQPTYTKFLGRFGKDQVPSKEFELTPAAIDSVRVTFQFYEIGSWDGSGTKWGPDKFYVKVNGQTTVDLGFFNYRSSEVHTGQETDGILWEVNSTTTPNTLAENENFKAQKHEVMMDIPGSYLTSKSLTLEFIVDVTEKFQNESGGIDDLVVMSCPRPS